MNALAGRDRRCVTIYYGGFLSRTGGAFMHVRMMSPELEKLGYRVQIVTLDSLPFLVRYLPHLLEKLVNVFWPPMGYLAKGRLTRALFRLLPRPSTLRIFEDIYLTWNSSTPSITILHAVWSDNLQAWDLGTDAMKRLVRREARILQQIQHPVATVSMPYHDFLVHHHFRGEALPPIHVVPLGVNAADMPRRPSTAARCRSIVYLGALEPRKNVQFLLQVFESLRMTDESYRMTVVGDGPDRSRLKQFCAERGLPVRFLGRLERPAALEELARHDLLVHTSRKESFSFALLEAKLCGLKTCAHADLQVPSEFIDAKVTTFEVTEWCAAIRALDGSSFEFPKTVYSSAAMAAGTLALIKAPSPAANWRTTQ